MTPFKVLARDIFVDVSHDHQMNMHKPWCLDEAQLYLRTLKPAALCCVLQTHKLRPDPI